MKKQRKFALKKLNIFLISAVVVTISTVLLSLFISSARAAEQHKLEVEPSSLEIEKMPAPKAEEAQKQAPLPTATATRSQQLPAYTLDEIIWNAWEIDDTQATQESVISPETATEISLWVAMEWLELDVENSLVKIEMIQQFTDTGENRAQWLAIIYCADKETIAYITGDLNSSEVTGADVHKSPTDYIFDKSLAPDFYKELKIKEAYLTEQEYQQAIKDCTKKLKHFEQEKLGGTGIKQASAYNVYEYSHINLLGNSVGFEITLNNDNSYSVQYICRKGEEPRLSVFRNIAQ